MKNIQHHNEFSRDLLIWFRQYGRNDLPWQTNPTAYRVWISEIMLQQTQVNSVIPYYQRFMQRFPDVFLLATAELDEVLYYWAGLGYYARARHLYQSAKQIIKQFNGILPAELDKLMALPGIGRSTAGAILALAYQQVFPILDGNVKRILCRYHAIDRWAGESAITQKLWNLAEQYTPTVDVAAYTQAIMDLGATVCTRAKPRCVCCPLQKNCLAYQQNKTTIYPIPKPRKVLPTKQTYFIMLQNVQGQVLLEKRQAQGIWGGLWSFPEYQTVIEVEQWCKSALFSIDYKVEYWQTVVHTFTHFHLSIVPVHIFLQTEWQQNMVNSTQLWYDTTQPIHCGLAAPVSRLLAQLAFPKIGERLL